MRAMTRFFREYGRVLLLCFMAVLLVIWLVQDSVGSRMNRAATDEANIEIGSAFGHKVRLSDLRAIENDVEIFQSMLGQGRLPGPMTADKAEQMVCWHLLAEEAKKAGVRVGRPQVEELLKSEPTATERFNQLARLRNRSQEGMFQSIGRIMAVYQYIEWQAQGGAAESLPRLEHMYRDRNEQGDAKVSAISAKAFLPRVPEPTEDELTAHFEAAKARGTAHNEAEHQFGYLNPDRVQFEYVTVNPADLISKVEVRDKEARRYFDDNKDKYVRAPLDTSPPAPGQPPPSPIQMTYEEAREQVKNDYRAVKAAEDAQRIINQIRDEARQPWEAGAIGEGGVRARPADAAIVSLESLVEKYSAKAPVKYVKSEVVDEAGLARMSEFAGARILVEKRPISAIQVVMNVEGLGPRASLPDMPRLRVGEPGPVVQLMARTPRGDMKGTQAFTFRILQAVPSAPPASLDEVRAKVVEHVKKTKAFGLAKEAAEALAQRAREVGLEKAVEDAADLKAILEAADAEPAPTTQPGEPPAPPKVFAKDLQPVPVTRVDRRGATAPNISPSKNLAEKLFATASQPAAAGQHLIVVSPNAGSDKWIVSELMGLKPVYEDDFKKAVPGFRQAMDSSLQRQFMMAWLDPQAIRQRAGYASNQPAGENTP